MSEMKFCATCRRAKPASTFIIRPGGYGARCGDCATKSKLSQAERDAFGAEQRRLNKAKQRRSVLIQLEERRNKV
jgi:hypothetical protein